MKRKGFPYRIGEYVTIKTDLPVRTALWIGDGERPLSKLAGLEAKITAINASDGEVQLGKHGWCPIGDLQSTDDISWDDDDDPVLDDEDEVLVDDDEILEDDEIIEDDDDEIL